MQGYMFSAASVETMLRVPRNKSDCCCRNVMTRVVSAETAMAANFLAPVKTDKQIYENSMLEDDPNANSAVTHEEKIKPRWGPHHKGAQELANLYSKAVELNTTSALANYATEADPEPFVNECLPPPGKRIQERICVGVCMTLMVINLFFILVHLRFESLSSIVVAALCGIITADFSSGLVHWAADTWGSVELPVIGKLQPRIKPRSDGAVVSLPDHLATRWDKLS
uniref:Lipid desaturase domain-containing protein n=1 Tax=Timema shepardi TaxID=629360 RepID=A0A7R9B5T2_TIMSH|nr:unnamed protein product [Timema shepardi]